MTSPTPPSPETAVVIIAKTRMGQNLCIGAVRINQRQGRCLRLLPAQNTKYRSWSEFKPAVGDVIKGRLTPCPQAEPPHTEDHILADGWTQAGHMKSARHLVSKFCEVWKGGRDSLFDGTLRWSNAGGGRIPKGARLPDGSVGFWELPAPAKKELHNEKVKYRIHLGANSVLVPFVGEEREQLPDVLPAGTIARMSLSRWWKPPGHDEDACWLQLSGYYTD